MGLEGRELVKRYSGHAVVDRLSLVVEPGQIVGLLGPNGAGKTTTFSLIMGFMSADHGCVLLDGNDISALPFYRRARLGIGYLLQEPSVFTKATVRENLEMALEGADDSTRRREQLLEEFHLGPLADQLAGSRRANDGASRSHDPCRGHRATSFWTSRSPASTPSRSPTCRTRSGRSRSAESE
jgi:ABC-type lipopolysaccharide export system ATPase subunit